MSELLTGAFFFVLRSCEYSTVKHQGRAKRLCLGDIQFFQNKILLSHSDPQLYDKATSMSMIFQNKKNGEKMVTISQFKNGTDLCPVLSYSNIIQRILKYPNANIFTPTNPVLIGNKLIEISSSTLISHTRSVVSLFGKNNLGFDSHEVGTHSIRSSTVMQLFLNKVSTYQIMLLGRWSSDAFFRYIR